MMLIHSSKFKKGYKNELFKKFLNLFSSRAIYREHCEAFLDAILNLEFSTIETLWREFWRTQDIQIGDECEEEKYLSKLVSIGLILMTI